MYKRYKNRKESANLKNSLTNAWTHGRREIGRQFVSNCSLLKTGIKNKINLTGIVLPNIYYLELITLLGHPKLYTANFKCVFYWAHYW